MAIPSQYSLSVTIFGLIFSLLSVSASPVTRVARQGDQETVQFTLLSHYTPACVEGLTPNATNIHVEYRLIPRARGESPRRDAERWIRADTTRTPLTVSVDSSDIDSGTWCMRQRVEGEVVRNQLFFTQFRVVQLEHGGGDCNCWGLVDFRESSSEVNDIGPDIDLTAGCARQSVVMEPGVLSECLSDEESLDIMFCGGSASVPRGVVSEAHLHMPNSTSLPCENINGGSHVSDPQQSLPLECDTFPRIDISFSIDFMNGSMDGEVCRGPARFDEGVELAVSNPDNPGEWIPLIYLAPSNSTNSALNVSIRTVSKGPQTVAIRGYPTNYSIGRQFSAQSVRLCGEHLRDGIQLRWLQTASFMSNSPPNRKENLRDLWALDDVTVTLHISEAANSTLLGDDFSGQTAVNPLYWEEEIRNGALNSTTVCTRNDNALLMGATCTTPGCGSNRQIIASRQVTTVPLTITFEPPPTTDSTTTPTTLPPTTVSTTTVDPDREFELAAEEDLLETLEAVLSVINGDSKLGEILTMPPTQAAESLERVVEERSEINTTVVAYLLRNTTDRASMTNSLTSPLSFSEAIHSIGDRVLKETSEREEPDIIAGSTLLAIYEGLASGLLRDTDSEINGRLINSRVQRFRDDDGDDDEDFTGVEIENHSIRVPVALLRTLLANGGNVTVTSSFYRNLSRFLPGNLPRGAGFELASPVLSTSLLCGNEPCQMRGVNLAKPFTVTTAHSEFIKERMTNDNTSEVMCVFWEFIETSGNPLVSGRWDTEGCVRNENLSDSSQTVCECTHLTNFAILLSAKPLSLPAGVALSLSIIGYIGVSLSVIAMLATITALVFLKSLWSMRNFIHINLCVSLILAQLTFVIGVTPYGGGEGVGPGCRTAAVIMHYLFLVSFMWMLMEGVVLYVALVRVFVKHQRRYMIGFFVFSYGAPLLYLGLCVPLGFALYSESDYGYGYTQAANETTNTPSIVCWLNPYTHFVWTFIAPVLVVILANVGFFIMALVIMHRHAKKQTYKSRIQSAKHWIKGSVSLVVVMGMTWIIGVLVFEVPALLPLAYIFTIFVTFQGVVIFIIFVLLSKQVKEAYSRWWKGKVAGSEILSKHFGEWSTSSNSTALTSARRGAESFTSSVNHVEHETKKPVESEVESEKKRVPTLLRQGTSFDITYVPSPTRKNFSNGTDSPGVYTDEALNGCHANEHKSELFAESASESTIL